MAVPRAPRRPRPQGAQGQVQGQQPRVLLVDAEPGHVPGRLLRGLPGDPGQRDPVLRHLPPFGAAGVEPVQCQPDGGHRVHRRTTAPSSTRCSSHARSCRWPPWAPTSCTSSCRASCCSSRLSCSASACRSSTCGSSCRRCSSCCCWSPGLAILFSALNVYARDLQHLLELVLLAWFWMTPIVYPWQPPCWEAG